MSTFTKSLTILATNQEGVSESMTLSDKDEDGDVTPMDLTDAEFLATVKTSRSTTAAAIATITVTVEGDPLDGVVRLTIPMATMQNISPGTYFYDFNIKRPGEDPDCLWISNLLVEAGVSKWT
jgi:hypothetical protein